MQNIDQEARDMATQALSRIDAHERVCAERYTQTNKTMGLILHVLAWGTVALITGMGTIIVILATHQWH